MPILLNTDKSINEGERSGQLYWTTIVRRIVRENAANRRAARTARENVVNRANII
jgi:hypothetical protein